ncbi:MAG: hydroxyethylthiazole kinase [Eubacteriales bacterium]|nr:hydroxyethylthiazole kinase [Eubacteriales bacterium]
MFEQILENVRGSGPLIHCITNYITTNDCANIILACGASPTMAEAEQEAAEIAAIAGAVDINIGNLNTMTVAAMHKAIAAANQNHVPVILDPVGAGASSYRMDTLRDFFANYRFAVIRGNVSELLAVGGVASNTKGVDAGAADAVTEENLEGRVAFFKQLSARLDAVVSVSGAIDIIASPEKAYICRNGHPMMSCVTGTGCMLSALTAAFCGGNHENILEAAAAATAVMGVAGDIAYQKTMEAGQGTGSFRVYLMDAVNLMDAETLNGGMKIEVR